MNIYQEKIDNEHIDSFWYDGEIASNGKYTAVACGSIRVAVDEESNYMNDYQALEYADERNWNDKDLAKFEWDMNNWFEIVDDENNSIGVYHDYDEVITELEKKGGEK